MPAATAQPAPATIAPRDLLSLADTTNDLIVELRDARNALGDGHAGIRDKAAAKRAALACLHSAREGCDALIAEIGRAT